MGRGKKCQTVTGARQAGPKAGTPCYHNGSTPSSNKPIFTSSGFCVGLDQYLDFERAWTNIFTMMPLVHFQQGLKGLKR